MSVNRITKNTFALYIRMFITMGIGIYTSRVLLNALGIDDYGIYNIVGGVISLLGFFNASMVASTQRYLNVGMTDSIKANVNEIFNTSINIHLIIGVITVLMLETLGLWFVIHKLVIPPSQFTAALWAYQCSVFAFFISIITAPFNAAIIAYEKMSIFAYLSIIEASLKLGIAFLITLFPPGRLKIYAILVLIITFIIRFIYGFFCYKSFPDIRYKWKWNKSLIKEMFGFSGWMIFGAISDLLSSQGVNMLINIFFGPILNAARAIAVQVQSAVAQFSSNFIISVNPQLVKSYSEGNINYAYRLAFFSSKLSFFLMLFLIVPIILRCQEILSIWLVEVPEYSWIFVDLILIEYLIRSSYTPIAQLKFAQGNIRIYQVSIAIIYILTFLLTYIAFKLGYPVYTTFVISIILAFAGLLVRVTILKVQQGFPMWSYLREIFVRAYLVGVIAFIICYFINRILFTNFLGILFIAFISFIINLALIWVIGFNKSEKSIVVQKIQTFTAKFHR
ncbi:MAG: lipopolysaccharide biosynthesis protein [Muribaculaceae bacterium]|nr:lipopolysaccharide biosynthesis protein [Muribaculaceae bacterium]